ncbi:MAG: metallopeptidase family protein [Dehalococcoidia bacterium]|nr:metallopeptidase family protein [Dehalococcoidia bacterium]
MERERFERLVTEAIEGLPQEFSERLENIAIVVQDWPTRDQLASVRLRHRGQLLGLYEGIPLTREGKRHAMVAPDKITIFQKPIEMTYRSDRGIVHGIAETVRHEIAHHFGISDERLSEIAQRKRRARRNQRNLREV